MDPSLGRFASYRFRRTFRSRLGGYLTVLLLVGLVGGLAMGALAGARRTQSTFPTFLAASNASDLQVGLYLSTASSTSQIVASANEYSPELTSVLSRLPHVRHVGVTVQSFVAPLSPAGRPRLPAAFQDNRVSTIGTLGGEYFSQDRVVADEGRLADPARPDEVVMTADAARLLHWHVGQTIPMGAYSFGQVIGSSPADLGPPQYKVDAKVVGIVAFSGTVANDEVDQYPTFVLFTPAFTGKLLAAHAAGFATYALRLDHRAGDVPAVERQIVSFLPRGSFYTFHVTSVVGGQVERATKPASIALGAFGVLAALAALLIAGQALSRTLRANLRDLTALRALGASPRMIAADALFGMFVAIGVGALVACIVCVALSPVAPIGIVRRVDPTPGLDFDWTVLGVGAAIFVVGLVGLGIAVVALTTRRADLGDAGSIAPVSSRLVAAAVRLNLPPAPTAGLRFALERGRGGNAVPVGSALGGAIVAVAVVVTTLTFGSGLSTLVSHPALYGWNWSYAIDQAGGGSVPPFTQNLLDHDRHVAAWTGFNYADAQIDHQTVPILLEDAGAPVMPPLLSGRGLQNNHEIVLGGATLVQLHKHVGDTVSVTYGSPQNAPVYVPPTTLRIVGTATLPALGNPGVLHVSMGTGAIVPTGIAPPAMQAVQTSPDPNQNGPTLVAVRLRNGVGPAAGLSSLQRIANATTRRLATDPNASSGAFLVLPVQQPAEIVNYRTMGATPGVLAASLAAGALVALGLTLVASVRRRRRELALLKTLGFAGRQVASVVAWHASVVAVVGLVVGLPVGVALGRVLWESFAHAIDVVPSPSVPFLQLGLVALGALVLANLVSFWPGRIAARTKTAVSLRSE
jgi:hypothetical protein